MTADRKACAHEAPPTTVAAAEFGVSAEEVARLASEAHEACAAARADLTKPDGT